MDHQIIRVSIICEILFFAIPLAQAVELMDKGKVIIPDEAAESIKIDGVLNETIWSLPPISREFITCYPLFGERLNQPTSIWLAYDDRHLYFAFKCHDTEPGKIKSSIARRDNISRDDFVGVSIDGMGNRQTTYEFYVNPDGIQDDGITSAVNGWFYDNSPDFVWESAGKIVDDGYQVELCIPLESIRFKSGKEVKMGMMFMRNISRQGKIAAWPGIEAGQTAFNALATVVYQEFKKVLNLDFQFLHSSLYRESDHQKLYSIDILNLLAAYQFNKYFFVRAAVRYDNYEEKLLTDFLASFTLIPGTVIHLGYGSLYEKKAWENNQWVPGQDRFLNMKNGLFFKVSYLGRIR